MTSITIDNVYEYHMTYYSGGGTGYDGGSWMVIKSPKSIKFENLEPPTFDSLMPLKARIKLDNSGRHVIKDWEDGSYTVYPDRSGIPHVFEPSFAARKFNEIEDMDDVLVTPKPKGGDDE